MRRSPRIGLSSRLGLSLALGLVLAAGPAFSPKGRGADDRPPAAIDVYEWSVWVGSPSQTSLNAAKIYRNAMPGPVGTIRPKAEEPELSRKFAVAPVSVVQVFGEPTKDVDIDLRVKKGAVLAHWPKGTERSDGLRWFKSDLLAAPPAGLAPGYLPEAHGFAALRAVEGALYLKHETRVERFLAYDTELSIPLPVKIRGGPEEYTLQNLTGHLLKDVAIIAPVEGGGYRVGWLDELPTATPSDPSAEKAAAEKKKAEAEAKKSPEAQARAAAEVFDDAEEKAKAKTPEKAKAEIKPLPPEGDADIRARMDQALNRPVTVNLEKAPRKEVLGLVAGQARIRYEVDEPTLAGADVDLNATMSLKAVNLAARDALAEVLGTAGLSYRITDEGVLFVTTAARLADETGKKAVIEGPPVKLTLSQPLLPSDPSYREITRDSYAHRLAAQGMGPEAVKTLLDSYAAPLFEPKGLIVLAHLSREAIDEAVMLDVFPAPRKFVRTAVVVAHGVDPRLQDRARTLIAKLGDPAPRAREEAETQLYEMGPVAVPVLEDALREKDVEIVLRERILLRLNRPVP